MNTPYRIALAQYAQAQLTDLASYEARISHWVGEAVAHGASLLVFPEYGAMELVSLLPPEDAADLQRSLDAMQPLFPAFDALYRRLAQAYGVYILAPSFPLNRRNVALFYGPSGQSAAQEKRIMTRFEREEWGIHPGEGLTVFDTALGRIGVAICYDCEFPLLARALAEAGAELILVPSCTDTLAGYYRVRVGAQARALENQCLVAQAPLVGEAPWSPATDVNIGAAGLFGPPDRGFPEDGVLALGDGNAVGWVYGTVDRMAIDHVRREGQVLNHRHWPEQAPPLALFAVRTVVIN